MTSILDKISAQKRQEVIVSKQQRPITSLCCDDPIRPFIDALKAAQPAIIAEIKKASPSKGIIRPDFDVATIAKTYAQHGAACLSVLTDAPFFQGDPGYIHLAKQHCQLPVLRKDFIIDAYQVHESRALGADCILLIVALLDDQQLLDYCQIAQALGMAVLIESHTKEELERAIRLPSPLIGINNRSLHTFITDLQCSIELAQYVPVDKLIITESGIECSRDIQLMQSHGINTFLIGESLMRSKNIGASLDQLILKTDDTTHPDV